MQIMQKQSATWLSSIAARLTGKAILLFAQFITAVRAIWQGIEPTNIQRIYFANHVSHGDFILVWTVLPSPMRERTRPVAGADYWLKTPLRTFIGQNVFNAVLIDRNPDTRTQDPIAQMAQSLDEGASLILFPEGTRNTTEEPLLPFKSGLYNLHIQRPTIELVPVWVANLNRVLPKGEAIPVPLVCTVTFGEPLSCFDGESREAFLRKAHNALAQLAPAAQGSDT